MYGHYPAFPEVAFPVLVGIFVVYAVFQVVWQQILKLQRGPKLQVDFRIFPVLVRVSLPFHAFEMEYRQRGLLDSISLNPCL